MSSQQSLYSPFAPETDNLDCFLNAVQMNPEPLDYGAQLYDDPLAGFQYFPEPITSAVPKGSPERDPKSPVAIVPQLYSPGGGQTEGLPFDPPGAHPTQQSLYSRYSHDPAAKAPLAGPAAFAAAVARAAAAHRTKTATAAANSQQRKQLVAPNIEHDSAQDEGGARASVSDARIHEQQQRVRPRRLRAAPARLRDNYLDPPTDSDEFEPPASSDGEGFVEHGGLRGQTRQRAGGRKRARISPPLHDDRAEIEIEPRNAAGGDDSGDLAYEGGEFKGVGADLDPKEEKALRKQLRRHLKDLDNCGSQMKGLSSFEKKKMRNRKASRVSRLRKKLSVYDLTRKFSEVCELAQVQGRLLQQYRRELNDASAGLSTSSPGASTLLSSCLPEMPAYLKAE